MDKNRLALRISFFLPRIRYTSSRSAYIYVVLPEHVMDGIIETRGVCMAIWKAFVNAAYFYYCYWRRKTRCYWVNPVNSDSLQNVLLVPCFTRF